MMKLDEVVVDLEKRGFREIECGPRTPELKAGARVRNYGEQFSRAIFEGTATVVKVMRRGTDEKPDSWEMSWGRPNVEVVVQRDPDRVDDWTPEFTSWADYGTMLAIGDDR